MKTMIPHIILLCFSVGFIYGQEEEIKLGIINGEEARSKEAKFMVYITETVDYGEDSKYTYEKTANCGGVLLDRKTVLTAAHCVENSGGRYPEGRVTIRYGTHDRTEERFDDIDVEEVILHPRYDRHNEETPYDIAILKLERKVKKNRKWVSFAKLPKRGEYDYEPGTKVKTYGWGDINYRKEKSEELLKTTTEIIESRSRKSIWVFNDESSPCHGDSGGPLIVDRNVVIGILSRGNKYCPINRPTIYVKVENFLKWIKRNR